MAKKKVKEATGFYNPFWTKDLMKLFGGNVRSSNPRYLSTIMNYKCETHLPFYVLPRLASSAMTSMQYWIRDNDGESVPAWVAQNTTGDAKKMMTALWKKGRFEQFMIGLEYVVLNGNGDRHKELVSVIKGRWDETMKARIDVTLPMPDYASATGGLNIVRHMKMGVQFGMANIHSKTVRSGPWQHPKYLYGRYFLAHYRDLVADGIPTFSHGDGGSFCQQHVPIPLVSLMFKIEDTNLIRGYMLNNKEVPAELLELWVDKSFVAEDSPHPSPLRVAYKRELKNKMDEAGVVVREVDNLDTILYDRLTVPKFKSIKVQKEWGGDMMAALMDMERESNGIATKRQQIDKQLGSIFSLIEGGFGDVMKGPDGIFIAGVKAPPAALKREYVGGFTI